MHGTVSILQNFAARRRRSPAINSYLLPRRLTVSGWSIPFSTIDEASVSGGSITANNENAGGIVGAITDTDTDKNTTSTISNSTAKVVTITAKTNAGGIAGLANGNPNAGSDKSGEVTIDSCTINSNQVKGSTQVGGVVGKAENAIITNLIVDGEVNLTAVDNEGVTKVYFGGIAGWSNSTISFTNTSFTINVEKDANVEEAANYVGGLVGYSKGTISGLNGIVITVIAEESNYVGGVFGHNANAVNSLTNLENGAITITPTVTGSNYVGGIAGMNEGTLNAMRVNAGMIRGVDKVAGIVGKNDVVDKNIGTISDCQLSVVVAGDFVITATDGLGAGFAGENAGTITKPDVSGGQVIIRHEDEGYTATDITNDLDLDAVFDVSEYS